MKRNLKSTSSHSGSKSETGARSKSKSSATERSLKKTTSVTSYIFGAPKPYKMAISIVILSFFAGFIINFDLNNLAGNLTTHHLYTNALIFGVILIGLPALFSGLISTPLAHLLGGTFYYRRSFLLAFFSVLVLVIVLLIGKFLMLFFTIDLLIILIFSYALIISVRHSALLATSNHRHLSTLPASINQTIFGFLFICFIPGLPWTCSGIILHYMLSFAAIFIITTMLWIWIVRQPFKRNFNVDGLLLMKNSLTQFTGDNASGQVLEKEFFSKLGQNADIRVGVVCIRDSNNGSINRSSTHVKTLLIIPSIHPGPFGILGGANLPGKLLKYLNGVSTNIMVFHGPATHDQNPVRSQECEKIAKAVRKLVRKTEFSDEVSAFNRIKWSEEASKMNNKNMGATDNSSKLNVCAQQFGNGAIYIHTSSPEPTDDIDYPTGEAVIQKAEQETNKKSLFIDAHNCLEPGTGVVFFGSKKANNIQELVGRLNSKLMSDSATIYNLSTGFASYKKFKVSEGLGPQGIQVLIVRCDPKPDIDNSGIGSSHSQQTTAYILLDGNNMVHGLRERILDAIVSRGLVDSAEVFTSDNHIVNATMGGYNPVGLKLSDSKLVSKIRQLVKKALKECKPSEVGLNSGLVKNIRIFGHDTIMRLSTTINSTISIMRSSFVVCQLLAITACWLVAVM